MKNFYLLKINFLKEENLTFIKEIVSFVNLKDIQNIIVDNYVLNLLIL